MTGKYCLAPIAFTHHHLHKPIEQISDFVRPGARLGMPLKTERRHIDALDALQAAIEQRTMGRANITRQRFLVDGKAVVLTGNKHALGI